jgi:hypothetical protein
MPDPTSRSRSATVRDRGIREGRASAVGGRVVAEHDVVLESGPWLCAVIAPPAVVRISGRRPRLAHLVAGSGPQSQTRPRGPHRFITLIEWGHACRRTRRGPPGDRPALLVGFNRAWNPRPDQKQAQDSNDEQPRKAEVPRGRRDAAE